MIDGFHSINDVSVIIDKSQIFGYISGIMLEGESNLIINDSVVFGVGVGISTQGIPDLSMKTF